VRMAASMAEMLGVGIHGIAEGVGALGRKEADAMGGTAKEIEDAIGGLFGARKKWAAGRTVLFLILTRDGRRTTFYFLPATLATASIRLLACGFVTWRWIRIAVGVTSFP
jgi:hypothetical protein